MSGWVSVNREQYTHPLLEQEQVVLCERVGLSDDGDEVDPRAQALHSLNVQGLEPMGTIRHGQKNPALRRSRVTSRANEIEARVHPQINLVLPLRLLLLAHIRLMLIVDEIDNGRPRVAVVDVVTEARRVDDGELCLELLLLKLGLDDFNLSQLVELLVVTATVVLGRGQLG